MIISQNSIMWKGFPINTHKLSWRCSIWFSVAVFQKLSGCGYLQQTLRKQRHKNQNAENENRGWYRHCGVQREELSRLDDYFKGTNAETAYLLGRYCGLRINEAFGLKWDNVNLEVGTITIDRQMQYQDGLIKLVAPKTRNSRRTIYLCPTFWNISENGQNRGRKMPWNWLPFGSKNSASLMTLTARKSLPRNWWTVCLMAQSRQSIPSNILPVRLKVSWASTSNTIFFDTPTEP